MYGAPAEMRCYICGGNHFQRDCECCWQCGSPHHKRSECTEHQLVRDMLLECHGEIRSQLMQPTSATIDIAKLLELLNTSDDMVDQLFGPAPRCFKCDEQPGDDDDDLGEWPAAAPEAEAPEGAAQEAAHGPHETRLVAAGLEMSRTALLASLPQGAKVPASPAMMVPRAATAPHVINPRGISFWQDNSGRWRDDAGRFVTAPVMAPWLALPRLTPASPAADLGGSCDSAASQSSWTVLSAIPEQDDGPAGQTNADLDNFMETLHHERRYADFQE